MDRGIEEKIHRVYHLDRLGCKSELRNMQRPKLDFTDDYLDDLSIDRLRHLLVAAYLQATKPTRGAG